MASKMQVTFILLIFTFTMSTVLFAYQKRGNSEKPPTKLAVLWTSGDRDVAIKMVLMYTYNAKNRDWWNTIQFIIWGPSAKLLAEDNEIQDYVKRMQESGVKTVACKACSDSYQVSPKLSQLGIDVKYMGVPFTELLKSDDWQVITF
jgi:hypothetical protein